MLDHIIRSGLAVVKKVPVPRPGSRTDERNGLVLTPEGKAAIQPTDTADVANSTAPQSPQQSRGNNTGSRDGGAPKRPRNVARGCGGNAGGSDAGASGVNITENTPQAAIEVDCDNGPAEPPVNAPADSPRTNERPVQVDAVAPVEPAPPAPKVAAEAPVEGDDDLSIPEFLRRKDQPGQKRQAA